MDHDGLLGQLAYAISSKDSGLKRAKSCFVHTVNLTDGVRKFDFSQILRLLVKKGKTRSNKIVLFRDDVWAIGVNAVTLSATFTDNNLRVRDFLQKSVA